MTFKILGTTDEVTTCDCCGKKNLKKTVALENEAGEVSYYGEICASAAVYGKKSAKKGASIGRLARALQFYKDNIGRMTVDQIHNRLSVCGLANCGIIRGRIFVWSDAGMIDMGAAA